MRFKLNDPAASQQAISEACKRFNIKKACGIIRRLFSYEKLPGKPGNFY
jgi:hypothetical protein